MSVRGAVTTGVDVMKRSMSSVFIILLLAVALGVLLLVVFNTSVTTTKINTPEPTEALGNNRDIIPVDVVLYYETLCPYSRNFVVYQLLPAYLRAPDLMNVSLIPYGHAKTTVTSEGYAFRCQHGSKECEGNKIHSCAVHIVDDEISLVKYVACMIKNETDPALNGQVCAIKNNITWEPIRNCAEGALGNELLQTNGVLTHALRPRLRVVPTVTLNGSRRNSREIHHDLLGAVCKLFPDPKPEECLQEWNL